jgi:transcriptional regulator with XRE-family HTH domain
MRQAGLTQQQVALAVDMDPTALSKALAGRRGFKSIEVALIAEELRVPTGVLLADEDAGPVASPTLAARSQQELSPAADRAIARAEHIREVDVLLNDLGYPDDPATSFPEPPSGVDPARQGELHAEAMRRHVGEDGADLPVEPDALASWVERSFGVDVCMMAMPAGLDGLALSSGRLRLALVSSSVAATRQRFTIAHELCHLACGDGHYLTLDEDLFRPSPEEKRANAFAAAFLMPADVLRGACEGRIIDQDLVVELLYRFRISLDALAFRMHNVGIVDARGRDDVRAMASACIAARSGRLEDLQARNGQRVPGRVLARAMKAFAAGDLSVRPLATLLDADEEQLLDELVPPRFTAQPDEHEPAYVW